MRDKENSINFASESNNGCEVTDTTDEQRRHIKQMVISSKRGVIFRQAHSVTFVGRRNKPCPSSLTTWWTGLSYLQETILIIFKLFNMKDFLEKNLNDAPNDAPMLGAFVNQSEEIKVEGFELIKVEERDGKQAINARELHEKLGNKKQFANWIQLRIEQYGFVENQDFQVFNQKVKNSNGGRSRKEYALSLDMAKELCMIENNEKGRMIRKYFIEVEKKVRMQSVPSLPDFTNPAIAARAWADQFEKNQVLTLENKQQKEELVKASQEIVGLSAQITTMKPKTTYFDVMMKNKSTSVITSMAQDYGMSPQAFNKLLHELGIQHKVSDQWVLYRQYLDKGYVNSEPVTITHNDGKQTIKYNTKWTQKGRFFLYEFLKEKGILPLIEKDNGETH